MLLLHVMEFELGRGSGAVEVYSVLHTLGRFTVEHKYWRREVRQKLMVFHIICNIYSFCLLTKLKDLGYGSYGRDAGTTCGWQERRTDHSRRESAAGKEPLVEVTVECKLIQWK